MSAVEHRTVEHDEQGMRLDRWFKANFPQVTHAHLNKLLRTGQVRVDGARAKGNLRLEPGQQVRVPPFKYDKRSADAPTPATALNAADRAFLESLVIFQDDDLLILNKPSGLAVQGGTKTVRHLDGLLESLGAELGERPRLVHRLDRDTSGVLVVAKRRSVASSLGRLFATRTVHKIYWAIVHGHPQPPQGKVEKALVKAAGPQGDRVRAAEAGEQDVAQRAVTHYAVIDRAGQLASWVSLKPVTGRQHQLRAHMAMIGCPILGDNKYEGDKTLPGKIAPKKLMLHARRISFPHPRSGTVDVTAPLPDHMVQAMSELGFDPERYDAEECGQ